jgi:hypothetical protein
MRSFDYFLNEDSTEQLQIDDYMEQVEDTTGWKPITDELYDLIEEEGWVQDLTEDMTDDEYDFNREIVKSGFEYKELELYYNWQKDHIKGEYDYTMNILNRFDTRLRSSQTPPYHTLMFVDLDNGKVYLVKYKKPIALT